MEVFHGFKPCRVCDSGGMHGAPMSAFTSNECNLSVVIVEIGSIIPANSIIFMNSGWRNIHQEILSCKLACLHNRKEQRNMDHVTRRYQ